MKRMLSFRNDERGATLVEFAIGASIALTVMFGVLEFGRALWVHNALTDAARRGARYAVLHPSTDTAGVKNVVVYGDPAGGTTPLVTDLATTNVSVNYSNFGLSNGTVTVSITSYEFKFLLPLLTTKIQMPGYATTLTGESAGLIPANL